MQFQIHSVTSKNYPCCWFFKPHVAYPLAGGAIRLAQMSISSCRPKLHYFPPLFRCGFSAMVGFPFYRIFLRLASTFPSFLLHSFLFSSSPLLCRISCSMTAPICLTSFWFKPRFSFLLHFFSCLLNSGFLFAYLSFVSSPAYHCFVCFNSHSKFFFAQFHFTLPGFTLCSCS